ATYDWPGNVRELRNAIEFAAATASGSLIELHHLPPRVCGEGARSDVERGRAGADDKPAARAFRPLAEEVRELERTRMAEALDAAGGVQTRAAELIGMPIRTFAMKLKQHNLSRR